MIGQIPWTYDKLQRLTSLGRRKLLSNFAATLAHVFKLPHLESTNFYVAHETILDVASVVITNYNVTSFENASFALGCFSFEESNLHGKFNVKQKQIKHFVEDLSKPIQI